MNLFVLEDLCRRPQAREADSLRAEGLAMLSAVLTDLSGCSGVEVVSLVDPALIPELQARAPQARLLPCAGEQVEELARTADYSLLIAPECDGVLAELCRRVERAGGRLLGPDSEAVGLCSDKLALAEHLQRCGVAAVGQASLPALWGQKGQAGSLSYDSGPLVLKPRDGAGSQATFRIDCLADLPQAVADARAEGWIGELIVQPFIPGRAVSVALLGGPGGWVSLPACDQLLSSDGRFRYQGGRLPLPAGLDRRARTLAEQAVQTVPGLAGHVGVDLVLGDEDDVVIEINPRLTTSYVGLRALARGNLMEALLQVRLGDRLPELAWKDGVIEFVPGIPEVRACAAC